MLAHIHANAYNHILTHTYIRGTVCAHASYADLHNNVYVHAQTHTHTHTQYINSLHEQFLKRIRVGDVIVRQWKRQTY